MKQGSDNKQSLELRVLKNFPDPDLLMEYFWASKNNPFHMIEDEKLLDKDKDVDYLPAWSLGKMIEGLPADLMFCEDDDDEGGGYLRIVFCRT